MITPLRIIALSTGLKDAFRSVMGNRLSKSTVHIRLREVGLQTRRPYKGMLLARTRKHLKNQWAQRHIGRRQRHWRYTMFSDES